MEKVHSEMDVVERPTDQPTEASYLELADFQLALVGGGHGEVTLS